MNYHKQSLTYSKKLILPMLWLLLSKAQGCKYFWKPSEPYHVGIHWKDLAAEYSQMTTHLLGFQSLFKIFASFWIGLKKTYQGKILIRFYLQLSFKYLVNPCFVLKLYSKVSWIKMTIFSGTQSMKRVKSCSFCLCQTSFVYSLCKLCM